MDNKKEIFIHPTAIVEPDSILGAGTRVWAYAHVMGGAKIGEDCNIGNYAFVERGAVLGNKCTVKNGVQVWEGVIAEDGVFMGPNCVFTNDLFPRSFLKRPKSDWLTETHIGKGATIGANATLICGKRMGKFSFVAAGALVTKDVPDYALVMGSPARFYCWICVCGKKLSFKGDLGHCHLCQSHYRKIEADKVIQVDVLDTRSLALT